MVVLFLITTSHLYAQSFDQNLQKYWIMKERFKNFCVVGDCQGCSIPAESRDVSNLFHYRDATISLGFYIGRLATEYKLLKDAGETAALQETSRELYYALSAFNRLDYKAEYYWKLNSGVTPAISYSTDLNGFYIRDDIPADFGNEIVNGDLVENQLSNSLCPLQNDPKWDLDGYKAKSFESSYTYGIAGPTSGNSTNICTVPDAWSGGSTRGPVEVSFDQTNQILFGLALVVKLVDKTDTYNNQTFLYEQTPVTSFYTEAKLICQRITDNMAQHGWLLVNPDFPGCAQGLTNCRTCDLGNPAGSNVTQYAWGVALANCAIQNDFNPTNQCGLLDIVSYPPCSYYENTDCTERDLFVSFEAGVPGNKSSGEDEKVLNIAAIGNAWGSPNTHDQIYSRVFEVHREHIWLFHKILYNIPADNHDNTMQSIYECMLNAAPCRDINDHNGIFEWSNTDRANNGPNTGGNSYNDEGNGSDYMLYFNLYCIANPSYKSGYRYIDPHILAVNDLIKTRNPGNAPSLPPSSVNTIGETEHKNFMAAHDITAGNVSNPINFETGGDYLITNDGDPGQALPLAAADVTFMAGDQIALTPGFSVDPNANFSASIDNTIQATDNCLTNPTSPVCTNCTPTGNEYFNNRVSLGPHKIYDFGLDQQGNPLIFVSTRDYLFKCSKPGGTGSNMFELYGTGPNNIFSTNGTSIIGYEAFENILTTLHYGASITDVNYYNNYLYVSLSDGYMFKCDPSGTGKDFLNLTPEGQPIASSYEKGYQDFSSLFFFPAYVTTTLVDPVTNRFFIGLSNGKVFQALDVGSGQNMLAIDPNNWSLSLSGYNYLIGSEDYGSYITVLKSIGGHYFVGSDEKLTKNELGTGQNMFVGHEIGSQIFQNEVVFLESLGDALIVGLADKKTLLIQGTGGTGSNMFAVNENSNSFTNYSGYSYYIGDQQFSGQLTAVYNDQNTFSGSAITVLCFDDGTVVKTNCGSGNNFSVGHVIGSSNFGMSVSDFKKIQGDYFIGFSNGRMLKLNSLGGSGQNMWGLSDDGCMLNLCGNYTLDGCQDFTDIGARSMIKAPPSSSSNNSPVKDPPLRMKIIPNPNNGSFNLLLPDIGVLPYGYELEILQMTGEGVYSEKGTINPNGIPLNLVGLRSSIYMVKVTCNNHTYYDKLIINN
jgi:hypothetical protein